MTGVVGTSQLSERRRTMAFKLHERDVMRKLLQTFAISALLLVPASAAHAQVSFGIQIGDSATAACVSRAAASWS